MDYHQMTMNEPRDSPQRRKQFLVICTIMAGMFAHGMTTAGAFSSMNIKEGVFPGGTFVYKSASRDYAASAALIESIALDVKVHPKREVGDLLYSLFLDDPTTTLNGDNLRFACGILVDNEGQDKQQTLLEKNEEIRKLQTPEDADLPLLQMWERSTYKTTSLPSVDSAVLQFPFTDGIVSPLVLNYKIIPSLRKYAAEHGEKGNVPIVMSTCSPSEEMCTHYAPLVQGRQFLLGQPDSDTYSASLPNERWFDWEGAKKGLKTMFRPLKWIGLA